ncbi:MAG TPA: UPF0158 family protein, partial [Bacillaceae bacterium]|nr:UPF0158 family protein [Bacillaceae bacterium]
MMQVKLHDILDGMEMQSEEIIAYLNLETGEIVFVSDELLMMAEDREEFDHLPDWEQDEMKLAIDIEENFEKYAQLPTSYDINDYDIMESFCYNVSDDNKRDTLLSVIKGKGAFGRFRDNVERFELIDEWYTYQEEKYKEIAV